MLNRRIGITGTHGAGKTTLARKLADTLNLPLISEVASEYTEKELRSFHVQCEILERQKQLEDQHRDEGFVSDRTLFCNYAYLLRAFQALTYYELDKATMKQYHAIEAEAKKEWCERYTDIFYLPPVVSPADRTERNWQFLIASVTLCLLRTHAPHFKTIHIKTPEERHDEVLKWLAAAEIEECYGVVQYD